jgi:hypothetical protein
MKSMMPPIKPINVMVAGSGTASMERPQESSFAVPLSCVSAIKSVHVPLGFVPMKLFNPAVRASVSSTASGAMEVERYLSYLATHCDGE